MTYYTSDKFSSSEVAGAVAEAALHDLRVNLFTFSGFPQIHVAEPVEDIFKITLNPLQYSNFADNAFFSDDNF